jgi:DNA-directed RNA polymerase subunit RPC12/RpoP
MAYKCSKCGLEVIIIKDKEPIKACKCKASIIAEMGAKTKGSGAVSNGNKQNSRCH